jgi:pyruvate/2-oxoacid:ferredoxin oxidoreductase beta subunit
MKRINLKKDISPNDFHHLVLFERDLKIKIAEEMMAYGGSFVKALAECIYRADNNNLRTLSEAFYHYFTRYAPEIYFLVEKSPDEWLKEPEFTGIIIRDPDGWDRSAKDWNKEWNTPLTRLEFQRKLMFSSIENKVE